MKLKTYTGSNVTDCSMADPAAGSGGFLTQTASALWFTPQPVIDYVESKTLLPCPFCGADARTWVDIDTPATYCRKSCVKSMRFYRKSAAASARAWNAYARMIGRERIQNPPFGS